MEAVCKHLTRVPLLSELTRFEHEALCEYMDEETYHIGELIIEQGESGDAFFLILEGKAKVLRQERPEGIDPKAWDPPVELKMLTVGDGFGERSLMKP